MTLEEIVSEGRSVLYVQKGFLFTWNYNLTISAWMPLHFLQEGFNAYQQVEARTLSDVPSNTEVALQACKDFLLHLVNSGQYPIG